MKGLKTRPEQGVSSRTDRELGKAPSSVTAKKSLEDKVSCACGLGTKTRPYAYAYV